MKIRHEVVLLEVPEYLGYRWVKGIVGSTDDGRLGIGLWHCETGPATYSGRNHRYYLGNELVWKERA